ncbi:MAG: FAD-binding protein [Candidatus Microthrix sp.]|jgi:L-aspartate oxidase|nr:FAD-dependent oxidoreductase [Candidatus Microthrix sp.]MBP7852168.1 FAD-binding protein [Candidatus Microthrix sp.]MBP9834495.1 FAD-binding protein [Candidatus Microthrix sp.]
MNELDLLVLGSGVAGLSAAVRGAEAGLSVGVLTKGELEQATTRWAQGGVAAALSRDPEELDLHLADTLAAGGGLCDPSAVRVLVDEGPRRVQELIALGAVFDVDEQGEYLLAREGGHSVPRILHAGGAATGMEIERALVHAVQATAVAIHEQSFATDLVLSADRSEVTGVSALDADGRPFSVAARNVLLATGGAGQLFWITTNPSVATGDGVAMAMRAGAVVADFEFFQFHPTALALPSMPRPLLSEALRGHGALLRDRDGERFVDELKPRDVVSRAMTRTMLDQNMDHLWLDATVLEDFALRFPTIADDLTQEGLDPAKDWLPVAPAAHHQCGGILTDLDGATSLPGLWAAGETTCSGVHGANRLASNSLLEGMVFGPRVVEAVAAGRRGARSTGAMRTLLGNKAGGASESAGGTETAEAGADIGGRAVPIPTSPVPNWPPPDAADGSAAQPAADAGQVVADLRGRIQRVMTVGAGVLRSGESLANARSELEAVGAELAGRARTQAAEEVRNLADLGVAMIDVALARRESRGCHTREDFPDRLDDFRVRLLIGG